MLKSSFFVGVARLELTTLWSQTRYATNCATPRSMLFKSRKSITVFSIIIVIREKVWF